MDTQSLEFLATRAAGFPVGDLTILRHGTHHVYRSTSAGVVIRLNTVDHLSVFQENLHTVRNLIHAGAPALPPLSPGIAHNDTHVVTAWQLGTPIPHDAAGLAYCLRRLHDIEYTDELPELSIEKRFDQRMQHTERRLGARIADILFNNIDTALTVFEQYCRGGTTVLHADAHGGNLVSFDGTPYLIDVDDLARGVPEFDLLPSYTSYVRFHRNEQRWQAFRDAYGAAAIDWDVLEKMRVIRETTMNTWLSTIAHSNDAARAELDHRLATWDMSPHEHAPWKPV